MITLNVKYLKFNKVDSTILFPLGQDIEKVQEIARKHMTNQRKNCPSLTNFHAYRARREAPVWLQTMGVHMILYNTSTLKSCLMTSRR